jgi:hypothetical protein
MAMPNKLKPRMFHTFVLAAITLFVSWWCSILRLHHPYINESKLYQKPYLPMSQSQFVFLDEQERLFCEPVRDGSFRLDLIHIPKRPAPQQNAWLRSITFRGELATGFAPSTVVTSRPARHIPLERLTARILKSHIGIYRSLIINMNRKK